MNEALASNTTVLHSGIMPAFRHYADFSRLIHSGQSTNNNAVKIHEEVSSTYLPQTLLRQVTLVIYLDMDRTSPQTNIPVLGS